jgi:hypothetical protein
MAMRTDRRKIRNAAPVGTEKAAKSSRELGADWGFKKIVLTSTKTDANPAWERRGVTYEAQASGHRRRSSCQS